MGQEVRKLFGVPEQPVDRREFDLGAPAICLTISRLFAEAEDTSQRKRDYDVW